jgi:hypothetical protein
LYHLGTKSSQPLAAGLAEITAGSIAMGLADFCWLAPIRSIYQRELKREIGESRETPAEVAHADRRCCRGSRVCFCTVFSATQLMLRCVRSPPPDRLKLTLVCNFFKS